MATLVLTTIGGAIGGPIGAALGGLLGQAVDREVFRPKARSGPRLIELAVQTSSYGTPIGRVFGTMRIAGSVIWSTDLIERRATSRGGKGQPSTTNYSYSASFAVALSSRPIVGVGRIWADGKLLRGAAGDWKSATAFRLHLGGEDQPPDPLIAALEGAARTPAHRGIAYAVFEELQLADFGNRIPSLTFEVIGDAGAVPIGDVAQALGDGAILGSDATPAIAGFSAYGEAARGVLEQLADAAGAWFAPVPGGLALRTAGGPVRMIDDAGYGAGDRRTRTVRAIETVPRALALAYYDPGRDFQVGLQQARRPGAGHRSERIELPAAIDAADARAMADAMLARAETARTRRRVTLDLAALDVAPGDRVAIRGEAGDWRVANAALEAMTVTLDILPLDASPLAALPASAGRVLGAPDVAVGDTIVAAFETPALDDALLLEPRLTIAAAGTAPGWRRAALLYSLDDGATWISGGATAAPAAMGVLAATIGPGAATLSDDREAIEVALVHDGLALEAADAGAIDRGANLALVGDELLQFADAEQVAPARWRLTGLSRARRGTRAPAHAAGERFVLIERDAATSVTLPIATVGRAVRVLASGVGDVAAPTEATAFVSGASIAPPSPVHLRAERLAGGEVRVRWIRRSRIGWNWRDGADVPLGEEREAFRVTITPGAGEPRTIMVDTAQAMLTAAEGASGCGIDVRQLGTSGESAAARLVLDSHTGDG